jgi:phosphonate transport system permease protein
VPSTTLVLKGSQREREFINNFVKSANSDLVKPFGEINWRLFGPLLVFTAFTLVFFEHSFDLGKVKLNWTIVFDVNLATGLLILAGGIINYAPKIAKQPQLLRNQRTITSLVLTVAVAVLFFLRLVNFGTFNYLQDNLDLNALVGLVFLGLILGLAFRGSVLAVCVLAAFFLWWGFSIKVHGVGPTAQNFGFTTIADLFTNSQGSELIASFVPPKWDYFTKAIDPLFLTVQTAVASTIIGVVVALPLSILAAKNTTLHPVLYSIVRFIINTIRSIPALILALLFIPLVGLGPAAGILGLGIHSISTLTKLYSEAFESVKPQPIEAMSAVGANSLKRFRWGVFPQAYPLVASYSIYNFESNTRDSTVVAFVGGGGIGFLIQQFTNLLDYATVAVLLIMLILTVSILDRFSAFIRSKII